MLSISLKSFFIETYGCAANQADSAIMEGLLRNSGYQKTSFENARYIIVNTCAVKQATENKIRARLRELYEYTLKKKDKNIIIAGCLPLISPNYIDKIQEIIPNYSAIVDLNSIITIVDVLERIEHGEDHLIITSKEKINKSDYLLEHESNDLTGTVPISEGCHGACTYCCVKNARGALKCYDSKSIVKTVEHYLQQGKKQIYLTSQDCSTYRFNSTKLVDLVNNIHSLPYNFFLRLGMINPQFLIKNLDQIKEILNLGKVYQFLHLPIQSGSDRILKRMNRPYRISDIIGEIAKLNQIFPYLTLSTDIICGFPGETEYDFYKTINFIKWFQPEILNISQFTPRPNTKAKQMEQLKSEIIKDRSKRLSKVFRRSLKSMNLKWLGWEGNILVLHSGNKDNQVFGRNFAYKNVFLNDYQGDFGQFVKVKIIKVQGFNLYAKVLK
ncbi:MAG: tRNA (N(6)-L-threonylcarbamoyladenosine(37)-C(2))-methylthiotransferase [Promethearchaeota archaeon]|nr:MAG: tRNA (N(6)-L-threonylcarbamoyladenosine(37)-C(2))-methylthiotransferase [Candidatus Lokiarchaeota archaeon]